MMNYSIQTLQPSERMLLQKRVRNGAIGITVTVVLAILLATLMTSFGKYSHAVIGVWGIWGALAMLIIALIIIFISKVSNDLTAGVKICGEFPVEKEIVSGRNTTTFYFKVVINGEGHRLGINKEVYDVVLPGEVVYAEFTPRSGTLFRLVVKGQDVSVKIK